MQDPISNLEYAILIGIALYGFVLSMVGFYIGTKMRREKKRRKKKEAENDGQKVENE